MAHRIKFLLSQKLASACLSLPLNLSQVESAAVLPFITTVCKKNGSLEYSFDLKGYKGKHSTVKGIPGSELDSLQNQLLEKCCNVRSVDEAYISDPNIVFKVNSKDAVNEFFNSGLGSSSQSWKGSPLIQTINPLKLVVEFSSPSVAKPFHVGHLRSTLIGNFISNVAITVGHDVTRINYLGDWGTQLGLLKYACDVKNWSDEKIHNATLEDWYKLYVWINRETKVSPSVMDNARKIFAEMEKGNEEHLRVWKILRNFTVNQLKKAYKEMNVVFDRYDGESMYTTEKCNPLINILQQKGKLENNDGCLSYTLPLNKVTLIKSDGSTLYLTRDLAAALDRFQTYDFDKMLYVVESGQADHFRALKTILSDINPSVSERLQHVVFGRITGMSTRQGTAVFLSDLLKEAELRSFEYQKTSKNTKTYGDVDNADIVRLLAPSTIIFSCLHRKKATDYTFSWKQALRFDRGGIYLQYANCRLANLLIECSDRLTSEASCEPLTDPNAVELLSRIAQFDEILYRCNENYDPSILADYLTRLCTDINRAYLHLPVKHASVTEAGSRLMLFKAAKNILSEGMTILGLEPMERM